ncbi:MAG: hypothetical protein PHV73_03560 [Eubacteriales bacterium]|nr:hypothetical protein [Eubacteriales bacterium]
MNRKLFENGVEKIAYVLQMIIALLIAIGLLIGIIDLVRYFSQIYSSQPEQSYDLFQTFLAYALLLIIGAELILMILYHSTKSVLELIILVIARKMLIYSHTMLDLVFGTLALAAVFAIQRFLIMKDEDLMVGRFEKSPLSGLQELIVGQRSGASSGGNSGRSEASGKIAVGSKFLQGDSEITVTKVSDEGDIEEAIVCSRVDYKSESGDKS